MASTAMLLGPPALRHPTSPSGTVFEDGDILTDSLIGRNSNLELSEKPPLELTENKSPTFLSSGNPCLDFFFHVVPDTPSDDLIRRLELAWEFNPLTTLKLICNLRGVRGTGKSDKEGFYTAALWLHDHHPKTLACNARVLASFGYFKDFLEILYRLLEGPEIRRIEKKDWLDRKGRKKISRKRNSIFKRENRPGVEFPVEEKDVEHMVGEFVDKEKARVLRKERELALAKRALHRYSTDSNYQFLHDQISDLFAELLKSDIQYLNSGELYKISLASKWFRDRLRKQVLSPLRKALELPEVFMCSNQWGSLPYNRVASVAMKSYKSLFSKHDTERFGEYLEIVQTGKAKIAAGALLPHEIIASLNEEDGEKVAELQWARMVEDLSKKGRLTNCIAVCDVSGSISGTPMEVCVALGLLVSELSEDPWKGNVITFSESPELHKIQGDSLVSKTEFVRMMEWGANTDFQKVFDKILQVAVEGNLSEDQMIKRVFVFSDMEFDEACGSYNYYEYDYDMEEIDESQKASQKWETDYEVIQRKFQDKGYGKVPEIKNLLTLFLEGGGILTRQDVMDFAISGEDYKKLVLFD
ncbi:hypothetical protein PVL29_006120 [Vitis rotundifolia]|uniref:Uncharacterized protein n=1 Tax=Vitis rotundifolia TaxID=103349 RepID=A0AA39A523_VITRO|nr:hypothetical protein PVL29_006120 [Vitis rotundifolia]